MSLWIWVYFYIFSTREKFDAVLYPKVKDCEKNRVVCEPDLEITADVMVLASEAKDEVHDSIATIMPVEVC